MPKDKFGNQLTWKEFFHRWKQGIEAIDIVSQTKIQIRSTWIMIIGIIAGIIISIMSIKTIWWLLIVLIGALGNTSMQLVALYQKLKQLKIFEEVDEVAG